MVGSFAESFPESYYNPEASDTALVDLSGVLADFDGSVEATLRQDYPDIPIHQYRTSFRIADDYPENRDLVLSISERRGFFEDLELMPHALEGVDRILDAGYKLQIVSAPLSRHPNCEVEKRNWIKKHLVPEFGAWILETAMITDHKADVEAFAMIDDRPDLTGAERAPWQQVMFDQPYNQGPALYRLFGWRDPGLEEVLESTHGHYHFGGDGHFRRLG